MKPALILLVRAYEGLDEKNSDCGHNVPGDGTAGRDDAEMQAEIRRGEKQHTGKF